MILPTRFCPMIRPGVMAMTPRQRYQPRSGVMVMRSQQRYRKLCRHGSGSIRRPLGPTIRMTAPQRRPFLPPVRRHDLRRDASGQAREGQHMRPVVPPSWLLRNTAPPELHRPGLRRMQDARMERVRDRFADRPPRSCFRRTCSSTWPAPRAGKCGGEEGVMWEPKRLTAVVHRRAGFLRPSPSVSTRGLRCLG